MSQIQIINGWLIILLILLVLYASINPLVRMYQRRLVRADLRKNIRHIQALEETAFYLAEEDFELTQKEIENVVIDFILDKILSKTSKDLGVGRIVLIYFAYLRP